MKRTIIVGDVHGCLLELEELLEKVKYDSSKDSLYFLGDIINRGPDSMGVFKKIKMLKARSVMGNHEHHLLQKVLKKETGSLYIKKVKREFGFLFNDLLSEISNWPYYIETNDFILVHGGLIPGLPLKTSDPLQLTSIRTWDGIGKDLSSPANPPWFDFYHDSKLVVFGHWAAMNGIVKDNVIGIDTGCVYGKELTAIVLPERERVSVSAASVYCQIE